MQMILGAQTRTMCREQSASGDHSNHGSRLVASYDGQSADLLNNHVICCLAKRAVVKNNCWRLTNERFDKIGIRLRLVEEISARHHANKKTIIILGVAGQDRQELAVLFPSSLQPSEALRLRVLLTTGQKRNR